MFTGIVEELGKVQSLQKKTNLYLLQVKATKVLKGLKIGDSLAINGVCLTVTGMNRGRIAFDLMKETFEKTTLGALEEEQKVNLERALKADSRFDGHFVTGHVDGIGRIHKKLSQKNYTEFQIQVSRPLLKYIVPKGSVTVDGVSLTVGAVKAGWFSVYLIPHTLKVTTLGTKKTLDKVNVETDILAKYIINSRK